LGHCLSIVHATQVRRTVHQNIQSSVFGHAALYSGAGLVGLRDVAVHKDAACRSCRGTTSLIVDISDNDASTLLSEAERNGPTNAGRPACDNGDFVWETHSECPSILHYGSCRSIAMWLVL